MPILSVFTVLVVWRQKFLIVFLVTFLLITFSANCNCLVVPSGNMQLLRIVTNLATTTTSYLHEQLLASSQTSCQAEYQHLLGPYV